MNLSLENSERNEEKNSSPIDEKKVDNSEAKSIISSAGNDTNNDNSEKQPTHSLKMSVSPSKYQISTSTSVRTVPCYFSECTFSYRRPNGFWVELSDRPLNLSEKFAPFIKLIRTCKKHDVWWKNQAKIPSSAEEKGSRCEVCLGINKNKDVKDYESRSESGLSFRMCAVCAHRLGEVLEISPSESFSSIKVIRPSDYTDGKSTKVQTKVPVKKLKNQDKKYVPRQDDTEYVEKPFRTKRERKTSQSLLSDDYEFEPSEEKKSKKIASPKKRNISSINEGKEPKKQKISTEIPKDIDVVEPDKTGWSEARLKAWASRLSVPNAYYYRFNDPGEEPKVGKWSEEEIQFFLKRVEEVGVTGEWGLFSKSIPGRVGYQCSSLFRNLVKSGVLKCPDTYVISRKSEEQEGASKPVKKVKPTKNANRRKGREEEEEEIDIDEEDEEEEDDFSGEDDEFDSKMFFNAKVDKNGNQLFKHIRVEEKIVGTPSIWYTKDNLDLSELDFCYFCGSSGPEDSILNCIDCGESFHQYCFDPPITVKPEHRWSWRCPNCKFCEQCKDPGDEEKILVCEACDRSYHTFCLNPPISEIPEGIWLCKTCSCCCQCSATKPDLVSDMNTLDDENDKETGWVLIPDPSFENSPVKYVQVYCRDCGNLKQMELESVPPQKCDAQKLRSLIENRDRIAINNQELKEDVDNRTCVLCLRSGDSETEGNLFSVNIDSWVHSRCIGWSSEVVEEADGSFQYDKKELIRGRTTTCCYCGHFGATLKCNDAECTNSFHFPCGVLKGGSFYEGKKVFCCEKHTTTDAGEPFEFKFQKNLVDCLANSLRGRIKLYKENQKIRIGPVDYERFGNISPKEINDAIPIPIGYRATRRYWAPDGSFRRINYLCEVSQGLNFKGDVFPIFRISCSEDPSALHISHSIAEVVLGLVGRINMNRSLILDPQKPDSIRLACKIPNATPTKTSGGLIAISALLGDSLEAKETTSAPSLVDETISWSTQNPLSFSVDSIMDFQLPFEAVSKTEEVSQVVPMEEDSEPHFDRHFSAVDPEIDRQFGLWFFGLTNGLVKRILHKTSKVKEAKKEQVAANQIKEEEDMESEEEEELKTNPSGCARSEPFGGRKNKERSLKKAGRIAQSKDKFPILPPQQKQSSDATSFQELPVGMQYRLTKQNQKSLRIANSPIAQFGMFTTRPIQEGEMICEYVGEVIGGHVADKREKFYEKLGLGCYMFRLNDLEIVDATMKGGKARYINHSCEPNSITRIISLKVGEREKIMVIAKRNIVAGEEILYDYQFPFEDVKIPCACGAASCRGFLN
eukprot:TRINITY_DN3962_c0_g1_i3.p1 TRINITY_DN3962_c0_g1~~TRINITY_DN3962_c0_g1_i3.p1  ORF type:complete len:1306 (-),score=433.72 TRINITY_DN3962_c0_g1_i3:30-3947(-)